MFTPKQYRAKAVEYGELGKIWAGSNKRREFQKLEQSFTALADNEQWHEDNNHKAAHASESHGPSGATLAAEEEHILRCLGAALIIAVEYLADKAAKGALRQCRLHG
jgi:rubrerythrin